MCLGKQKLEGYELFLSESTSPSKRGAALYVNKKMKAEEIRFNVKFEESVWTQIKLNKKDMLLLGCKYKSSRRTEQAINYGMKGQEVLTYHGNEGF